MLNLGQNVPVSGFSSTPSIYTEIGVTDKFVCCSASRSITVVVAIVVILEVVVEWVSVIKV